MATDYLTYQVALAILTGVKRNCKEVYIVYLLNIKCCWYIHRSFIMSAFFWKPCSNLIQIMKNYNPIIYQLVHVRQNLCHKIFHFKIPFVAHRVSEPFHCTWWTKLMLPSPTQNPIWMNSEYDFNVHNTALFCHCYSSFNNYIIKK
jgi:hypothetical protein